MHNGHVYIICVEFRVPVCDTVVLVERLLKIPVDFFSADTLYPRELPDLESVHTDFSDLPHLESPRTWMSDTLRLESLESTTVEESI